MDKLINYEDLRIFRQALINDQVISELSGWSSDKISNISNSRYVELAQYVIPDALWYTSPNNSIVTPAHPQTLPSIVSNTYEDGLGIMKFGADLTSIGNSAMYGNTFSSVVLPKSVTTLDNHAFHSCANLTSISMKGVTSIGNYALQNTALTSVDLSNVTSIGDYALAYTALTSVDLSNVTSMGAAVFFECNSLTSVEMSNHISTIPASTFFHCNRLASITIPNNITSIGVGAFNGCNSLTAVYTPSLDAWCGISFVNVDANPLSKAHNLYVGNTLVTDLVIPTTITSIGNHTFNGATCLATATIPNSVTSISTNAFSGCSNMKTVTIDANSIVNHNYTSTGVYSYFGQQVTHYIIGNNVTGIGNYAFGDCSNLQTVTIGNGVTSIGESAFANCSGLYGGLSLPSALTTIGADAFERCTNLCKNQSSPHPLVIPNGVTSIGHHAFFKSWIGPSAAGYGLILSNTLTTIGAYAFYDTALDSVTIPSSVTSIGEYAFNADEVTIQSSTPITLEDGNGDPILAFGQAVREEVFASTRGLRGAGPGSGPGSGSGSGSGAGSGSGSGSGGSTLKIYVPAAAFNDYYNSQDAGWQYYHDCLVNPND